MSTDHLTAAALQGGPPTSGAVGYSLRVPSVLACGVLLLAVKAALRLFGFGHVIRWLRRRVQPLVTTSSVATQAVRTVERTVAMAGALYPGRALCLEQSLVLYYILRRQGVAAEYCQGILPRPFEAHAWIEYRGEVINDVAEHAHRFIRLPGQLP
jgi:hypothetical protein